MRPRDLYPIFEFIISVLGIFFQQFVSLADGMYATLLILLVFVGLLGLIYAKKETDSKGNNNR